MLQRQSRPIAAFLCVMSTVAIAAESKPSDGKKKEHASRISSAVDVQPTGALTDAEVSQLSLAAGRVLKHIAQARDAIQEEAPDKASTHIDQGLKLLAIIKSVLPHYKVKTQIKSGEHAYSDEDEVRPRYVALYDELERRDIISPIAQAKKESQLESEKHPSAAGSSKHPPTPLAVSHVDVNHTSAKLDIVLAGTMLGRAKGLLNDAKLKEADQALLAVQTRGVLFEYEEVDLPLEEAADNLKLAEMEMQEGRADEAKAALHVAIDQLKRYEKLVGDHRSTEVKMMHQEITKLTKELEGGPLTESEQKKLAGQIAQWWQGATKWFKSRTK